MAALLTIGLTGGVASGKSTAEAEFITLGIPVLDADRVAREVVALGSPALAEIAEAFGAEMLLADGTLDRRRMRERVFGNAAELKRLERITHPHIRTGMRSWKAAQTGAYCVISVAILVEAGMNDLVDRVLVIDAPESVQRERLRSRDGIDDDLATRMLAAQLSRDRRLAAADDILLNVGNLEDVRSGVARLHRFYSEIAAAGTLKAAGLRLPESVI